MIYLVLSVTRGWLCVFNWNGWKGNSGLFCYIHCKGLGKAIQPNIPIRATGTPVVFRNRNFSIRLRLSTSLANSLLQAAIKNYTRVFLRQCKQQSRKETYGLTPTYLSGHYITPSSMIPYVALCVSSHSIHADVANDVTSDMYFTLADIGYKEVDGITSVDSGGSLQHRQPPIGGTYFCGFIVASSTRSCELILQAVFNSCNFDRRAYGCYH